MSRRRNSPFSRDDLPLTADINVTSLVDVAFTLLVIFIITAPVLQGGVEVSVPEADVDPLTAEDEPFFVTVMADGSVYMSETEVTIEEFRTALPQFVRSDNVERVYVRGDSLASWARMLQVIGVVTQAGKETGVNYVMVGEPWTGN